MSSRLVPLRVTRRMQRFQASLLDTPVRSSEKAIFQSEEAFPRNPLTHFSSCLIGQNRVTCSFLNQPLARGMGVHASCGVTRLCPELGLAFLFPDRMGRAGDLLKCPYHQDWKSHLGLHCSKPVSLPVHQNYIGNDAEKSPFFLSVTLSDQNNQRVPQYRAILWRKTVSDWLASQVSSPLNPCAVLSLFSQASM